VRRAAGGRRGDRFGALDPRNPTGRAALQALASGPGLGGFAQKRCLELYRLCSAVGRATIRKFQTPFLGKAGGGRQDPASRGREPLDSWAVLSRRAPRESLPSGRGLKIEN